MQKPFTVEDAEGAALPRGGTVVALRPATEGVEQQNGVLVALSPPAGTPSARVGGAGWTRLSRTSSMSFCRVVVMSNAWPLCTGLRSWNGKADGAPAQRRITVPQRDGSHPGQRSPGTRRPRPRPSSRTPRAAPWATYGTCARVSFSRTTPPAGRIAWRLRVERHGNTVAAGLLFLGPPRMFMSERTVFVIFVVTKSTVYRRGFKNPDNNTKKAYKLFCRYLVKVPVHYVNFVFERTES